jgi:hypothetical protein
MGSLRKRLEKLEKASLEVRQRGSGSEAMPNYLNRFLEMVSGTEGAPYGPEDAEDDRKLLRKMHDLRSDKGWLGNQDLLDLLEQDALDNLANYYAERGDR